MFLALVIFVLCSVKCLLKNKVFVYHFVISILIPMETFTSYYFVLMWTIPVVVMMSHVLRKGLDHTTRYQNS